MLHVERQIIALIFEKPSSAARHFEFGIQSMGRLVVFLTTRKRPRRLVHAIHCEVAPESRRWWQGIVRRCTSSASSKHAAEREYSRHQRASDKFHPCQALADFFTLEEKFGGAAAASSSPTSATASMQFALIYLARGSAFISASPLPRSTRPLLSRPDGKRVAAKRKAKISADGPREAVSGAMAVYTIRGPSMGFRSDDKWS